MSLSLAALLSACGGGAGTVGLATGTALYTSAPGNVTVAAGVKQDYAIGGGTPTYTAASSNKAVATASASGTGLSIVGVGAGSATITVTDAAGATANVAVTVSAPPVPPATTPAALFTTAAGSLTVGVGATSTYTAGGGVPAYAVSSSNTAVATATVSGTSFSVSGVSPGSAEVVVTDAAGTALSLAVTVSGAGGVIAPSAFYTTAPSNITVAVDANATFATGGGRAPYSASSSNAGVAKVATNGSAILITGVSQGTAQVVLADSTGTKIDIAVTVGTVVAPPPLFSTAPSDITVAVDASATFSVGGGRAPYSASSSNVAVARVATNGTAFVITGVSQGTAQIVLADSAGATISVGVTVGTVTTVAPLFVTAPAAVALAVNEVGTYTIGGGKPAYSVSTGNASVARVAVNGTAFTITAVAPGVAKVTVTDTVGEARVIDVTVASTTPPPPAPTDLTVSPAAATGNVGDALTFLVSGGTPNYAVVMTNTSIASIESIGSSTAVTFTVRLNNVGDTSVTITDAAGKIVTVPITVSQTTTSLRLSPNALTVGENYTGAFSLNIYGGVGPYRAFTSDETLSSVSVTGSVLTVGLGSNTNRCINPITSDGTYIPNGTFDVTITTLDSLGASATSVMTIKDNGKGLGAGCPP